MVEFDVLKEEYQRHRIGPHLHLLILEVVTQRIKGRESIVGEIDDVLQAFVLEDLLKDDAGQLAWIFTTATSSGDVAKMLHHRCGRHLVAKRKRSVRDNLWRRSQEILEHPPFSVVRLSNDRSRGIYSLDGITRPDAQVTPDLVRVAAVRARSVQPLRSTATERNPRIYDEESLIAILEIFLREVRGPANNQDLDDFFRELLTPWEEEALVGDVESDRITRAPTLVELSPEGEREVAETLAEIDAALTDEASAIVLMKVLGASDGDVALRHSISRPTAAKRKDQAFALIRASLSGLDDSVSAHVVGRLVGFLEEKELR